MKLAKRRRENPLSPPTTSIGNVAFGLGALALGAGAGALVANPQAGLALAAGGGLVTAALSPRWREAGLATAGLGLAAWLVTGFAGAVQARKQTT
jgi:hypothetical protein